MNERLQELAEQAGLKFDRYRMYVPSTLTVQETVKLQKFAELIVRECANIVNSLDQYEGEGDCSTAEYMKKCFGVE